MLYDLPDSMLKGFTSVSKSFVCFSLSYPDDDALYYTFRQKCLWEEVKTSVLQQTMDKINVTHVERDQEPSKIVFTAKQRAKSARQVSRKFL